jgi:hypothetical protein
MNYFRQLKAQYRITTSKTSNYSAIELNQKLLYEYWKNDKGPANMSDKGFRIHSQFEEDGLLLYVFSKIGFTNRKGVEMCCGWALSCMLSNLILYHSFEGLLFDGSTENIEKARYFFKSHPNTFLYPPKLVQAWITKDNINELIQQNGFEGEIDIFSLDVDGVDYYLMKALNIISPRVVICEVQNVVPPNLALTVPYRDDFNCRDGKYDPEFRSVSLLAMVKLMREKGYRLIGCHRYGFNAIFLRNDVGTEYFPEINHEDCYKNSYTHMRMKVWEKVANLPWVSV